MKAIIGRKVGMSQIFDEKGHVIPVTVIEAGPCVVTQKKTNEKDGYEAVQLGYEDIREAKLSKPEVGHLNKAGVSPKKYLREFDLDNASELELGAIIKADTFKSGDFVDVTGTSKGHGYTGVIKRWNASRGRMSHGGGPVHRHAGSMGICDIMQAERVVMVVSGESKAGIVKEAFTGPVTPQVPASILQLHKDFTLVADEAALSKL